MFTVRIEFDRERRDVTRCDRYHVVMGEANKTAEVTMYGGGGAEPQRVSLKDGAAMFVMNEGGTTVDIVRTTRPVPAMAGSGK